MASRNARETSAASQDPIARAAVEVVRWRWRNLRTLGFCVGFWPLDWAFGIDHSADVYGGSADLSLGPLIVGMSYSIGGSNNPLRLEPGAVDGSGPTSAPHSSNVLPGEDK